MNQCLLAGEFKFVYDETMRLRMEQLAARSGIVLRQMNRRRSSAPIVWLDALERSATASIPLMRSYWSAGWLAMFDYANSLIQRSCLSVLIESA